MDHTEEKPADERIALKVPRPTAAAETSPEMKLVREAAHNAEHRDEGASLGRR